VYPGARPGLTRIEQETPVFNVISKAGVFAVALAGLIHLGTSGSPAQEKKDAPPIGAHVFVHPEKLTAKDVLSFGEKGERIEINGETTLVYVDLAPDARFAHPTECVLISAEGTRVVKGTSWLVLNGKPLFRDGKGYKAEFPIKLTVM
jgi:uncharacterized Zn-binding protein involved in type VI secretion